MADVICTDDLDLYGRDLDDPLAELAQDVRHLLLEDYGSNVSAPTRGAGLLSALSGPFDPSTRRRIEDQLRADDRVSGARVTVDDAGSGSYVLNVAIVPNTEELGIGDTANLSLTYSVDANGNLTEIRSS